MSSIVPFSFKGAGVRVVADDHGESWFVGRDLCSALGYADQTSAMKQHCRGVVKYHPIADSLGRMQDTRILAEPDMLRLVINSQLPAAEQFERWVFEDVLPTIRRTGSYQMPANDATIPVERQLPIAADSLDAAKRIADCFGLEGNQALLSANSMVKSAIGVDLMEMAGVKRLVNESQEMNFTPTELGAKFGMSAVSMNKLLAECGLQHQVIYKPGKKRWEVTPDGKLFAVITDTGKKHSDGKPVQQILWKESVQEMLARLADQLRSGLPAVIAGGVRR